MKTKLVSAIALVLAGGNAVAAGTPEVQLETVVVTATKRAENVLDVPLSVTAIGGNAVRERAVNDAASLASMVPGLQVQENDLFPAFFMRGVGLMTETNDLNDQPVGTYLDEVYLGAPSLSRGQLFDVDRIEVLRGPQGTLFGRNTSAGIVHYITRGPAAERDGYLQVGYGSFSQRLVEGAIGGGLGERVRARISGKYLEDDGWQSDRLTGADFAKNDQVALRAQVAFDVTDQLEASLKLEYAKQDNTGTRYGFSGLLDPVSTGAYCSPDEVNAQQCIAGNGYADPSFDPQQIATDDPAADDLETTGETLRVVYSGESFNFTSITAYRNLDREWIADGDATPLPFFGGAVAFRTYRTTDARQFSQEFRFDGSVNDTNWVAGIYYYDDSREFLTSFPLVFTGNKTVSDLGTTSIAGFAQVDTGLTDTLRLVAGVRYSDESRDITQVLTPRLNVPATTVTDSETTKDRRTTGRMALEWRPFDGTMFYGSLATGFKSGTFAQSLNASRGIDKVNPEDTTTFEIGAKSKFWDGRAQTSVAIYSNMYRDFQATGSGINPANGTPINLLRNVGEMRAKGFEGELTLLPMEALQVNLGLTYTDTRISSTQNSGERDPETNEVYYYDGNPAPNTPKWRVNGSVRWMFPATGAGQFGALAAFNYQDDVNLAANANRYLKQDAYGTVDLTGLWESPSKRYFGQVFVRNLTDEKVAGWQFLIAFVGTRATVWGLSPRQYGARFGVNF